MHLAAKLILAASLIAVNADQPTAAPADLASLLPAEARGYRAQTPDETYDRDTLFELINGGAEVYRSLNVRRVLSRRYAKPGAAEIMVDLFDMGSPSDAFGAFHHDMREGKSAGLGVESEHQGSSLFFWKGRYFVSVVALADNRATRAAVLALGKPIARAIRDPGTRPDLVGMLPSKGLVKSQLHYFHDWKLLSRLHSLGDDNLLDLDRATEGILARYRARKRRSPARAPAALLLVRYPSAARAGKALDCFTSKRLAGANAQGLAETEGRGWAGAKVIDRILVGVLDAHSEAQARALLDEARTAVESAGKTGK